MSDQDQDRNEAATPFKLKKAREKGQLAKSSDLVSAVVLAVAVFLVFHSAWKVLHGVFGLSRQFFIRISDQELNLLFLSEELMSSWVSWYVPLGIAVMGVALLVNLVQTGPVFAPALIALDFNRLDLMSGLKRIFSLKFIFELFRSFLKLGAMTWVACQLLKGLIPRMKAISGLSVSGYLRFMLDALGELGWKLTLPLLMIALMDLMFVHRDFFRKMRMSRRELKEEFKQRDGDPRIRSRRRALRMEARKRSRMSQQTRQADVLVTNPTHVAVALRYAHGQMDAPLVLAKGAGQVAAVMRRIAARHRIPVVRSPHLARQLFTQLDIDQAVPSRLFAEVARVIVWVLAMRERAEYGRRGAGA